VRYVERSGQTLSRRAIAGVVERLVGEFPDGVIRVQRQALASCPTGRQLSEDGSWQKQPSAALI